MVLGHPVAHSFQFDSFSEFGFDFLLGYPRLVGLIENGCSSRLDFLRQHPGFAADDLS